MKQAYVGSLAGALITVKCVTDPGCELLLERDAKWYIAAKWGPGKGGFKQGWFCRNPIRITFVHSSEKCYNVIC